MLKTQKVMQLRKMIITIDKYNILYGLLDSTISCYLSNIDSVIADNF